MSKPTQYLITANLVSMIEQAKLSLHQLRLLHACLAYVDRTHGLDIHGLSLPNGRNCIAACSDLSAISGSPGQKSASWVAETATDKALRKFFRHISVTENGRLLEFRFQPRVGTASGRNPKDAFVIIDSDELAKVSSAPEMLYYTRALMCDRAQHMKFLLPLGGQEWNSATKKSWLRIAARVSARLGQEYLIVPKRDPMTRRVAQVIVKITSDTTRWSANCLYPRVPSPPVSIAHDGKFYCLSATELKRRYAWTRVTCP